MSTITVTRRGRVAVGVCVLGVVMALAAGGRSLNAVILPGVVALVAGYYQVARLDDPGVQRRRPPDGVVGETHEVRLSFHGDGPGDPVSPSYPAAVTDRVDDGLEGPEAPVRTSIGTEPASYRVRYLRRGERRLGPVGVTATDVFGLFERRTVVDEVDTVIAYPKWYPLPAAFRRRLYAAEAVGRSRQREEFDRLREYARGDPLRDVHWPTTAKHDEIVVKEFAAETERRRVSIAGGTVRDRTGDDALASATASLALGLLNDGVPVDVTLPAGEVSVEPGPHGRRAVLELAALTGPGSVDVDETDVHVVADSRGARYRIADRTVAFDDLRKAATPTGSGERSTAARRADDGSGGDGSDDDRAGTDQGGTGRGEPDRAETDRRAEVSGR